VAETPGRGDHAVLFTGFPGFIGARLLPKLLQRTHQIAFECLVQERFLAAARTEIAAIESRHPEARGRLAIVTGDITHPGLGIEAAAAAALKRRLVGACHLAAVYDLAVKRDVGMRINVQGTRNVLAFLADARRLRRLDYVSTAYVSGRTKGVFRENDLDVGQSFKNHYEETKFLAEVDVRRSGLPATVYRPGIVVGDSRTGETAKFDGPYFVLSAMEKLPSPGAFLRIGSGRNPVNLVPVDFVIEALASLATSETSLGKTYHLTDPRPVTALEIAELLARAIGKVFRFVPMPLSMARVLLSVPPTRQWLGIPKEALDYFDNPCDYDASQATSDLAAFGITCPRFPDYAERLVTYYQANRNAGRRAAMI
jgi:thioester reductase-like protein